MGQKLDEFLDYSFGFRKFIAFGGLFLLAVVFRLKGLIDGGQVVDLLKNTFIAFCAANGIEHFTTTAKTYIVNNSNSLIAQAKSVIKSDSTKE